jgi:hypothetical protein
MTAAILAMIIANPTISQRSYSGVFSGLMSLRPQTEHAPLSLGTMESRREMQHWSISIPE